MRNLRLWLKYNGTAYHGWQIQENADTVQGQLESAIDQIFCERISVNGCSRTDAGVHANEFCCNFRTDKQMPCDTVVRALNAKLPLDIVDGYVGFLFLTRNGLPRHVFHYDEVFRNCVDKYNRTHALQLPNITPHILRHTFCTNCINAGMSVKSVQYLMGHATSAMTLDVYADSNMDKVSQDMKLLRHASN